MLLRLRTKDYSRDRNKRESEKVKVKKWNQENRRVVVYGCIYYAYISGALYLGATRGLLEEGAISYYLSEFSKVPT